MKQSWLGGLLALSLIAISTPPREAVAGKVGIMVDGGVPDGANVSLVFRPLWLLRLHGGASHNYVSNGMRGGITLSPIGWLLSPTLSVEAGRYYPGDANPLARMITGDPELDRPELREVSYDYANLRLGLELELGRFTFYVHGGASMVDTTLRNFEGSLSGESSDGPAFELKRDPKVRVFAPSARFGFILYL